MKLDFEVDGSQECLVEVGMVSKSNDDMVKLVQRA
jgi:hypothetical protein